MGSATMPRMRRHDSDWRRIGTFAALIGYHVGMLYMAWPFHVKSAYECGPALTALMLALNPWRLPLASFGLKAAQRYSGDLLAFWGQSSPRAWARRCRPGITSGASPTCGSTR